MSTIGDVSVVYIRLVVSRVDPDGGEYVLLWEIGDSVISMEERESSVTSVSRMSCVSGFGLVAAESVNAAMPAAEVIFRSVQVVSRWDLVFVRSMVDPVVLEFCVDGMSPLD